MKPAYSTKFSVTILGSNSALPANGRHPTSQLLNVNNHYYLIDCGEGTQMQLRRYGLKMQRIKAIFISHMHGDHYFGLVGLLNSLHLLGRKMPLAIYAPPALRAIMDLQLEAAGSRLQYPITFHGIDPFDEGTIDLYSDAQVRVKAFNVKHRIRCYAYRFTEQERERTYLPEEGQERGVKVEQIPLLKQGKDVKDPIGNTIKASDVTLDPPPVRSYTFCTDTLPLESTSEHARHSTMLYHEATFLESERERSKETYHSTAREAAQVAARAEVKQLMIGHYSARYSDLEAHREEALEYFDQVLLAREGEEYEING